MRPEDIEGLTVGGVLDLVAESRPEDDALVYIDRSLRYSYAEFKEVVERCARALMALGLEKGDHVAVWGQNVPEWVTLQFATGKTGTVLVTINPAYKSNELRYVLEQSDAAALFLTEGVQGADFVEILEDAAPGLDDAEPGEELEIEGLPYLKHVVLIGDEASTSSPGIVGYDEFLEGAEKVSEEELEERQDSLDADEAINMQYTSGTTGFPKVLQAVHEERCTALLGVPTMFIAELEHPEYEKYDTSSLRTGIMAGSPCPEEVMKQVVNDMGAEEITIPYGHTESTPFITQPRTDDPIERRVSTVGRALPDVEVKIVNPDTGEEVGPGEQGELCTRGYHVMKGYYKMPEETGETIDEEGWLHTGDLATMDEDGYVQITGRADDTIIRGGENIYPREIEEFLYTHPEISDVQVFG